MTASGAFEVTTVGGISATVHAFHPETAGAGLAPIVHLHSCVGPRPDQRALGLLADATGRDVFAPELPGYGSQPGEERVDDLLDLVLHGWDLVDAVLAATGHDAPGGADGTVVLSGTDLGGMLAADMAAINPRQVSHLLLAGPLGMWVDEHPIPDVFAMLPFELPGILFADAAAGAAMLTGGVDLADADALTDFMIANSRRLGTAGKLMFPIPERGWRGGRIASGRRWRSCGAAPMRCATPPISWPRGGRRCQRPRSPSSTAPAICASPTRRRRAPRRGPPRWADSHAGPNGARRRARNVRPETSARTRTIPTPSRRRDHPEQLGPWDPDGSIRSTQAGPSCRRRCRRAARSGSRDRAPSGRRRWRRRRSRDVPGSAARAR